MNGCHDRAPLLPVILVQDGWTIDERRNMVLLDDPMTKDCQYRKTDLGKADAGCDGCKWRDAE